MTAYFLNSIFKVRLIWNDIFQVLRENDCQLRLSYPAKSSIITEDRLFSAWKKQVNIIKDH